MLCQVFAHFLQKHPFYPGTFFINGIVGRVGEFTDAFVHVLQIVPMG